MTSQVCPKIQFCHDSRLPQNHMMEAEFCASDCNAAEGEAGGDTQGICETSGTQTHSVSRDSKRIHDECGLELGCPVKVHFDIE